jgi:hypothetical protein
MSIPRSLNHYTEINSLALILANQTIRFSALNTVNDTSEGISMDSGDLGMYVFVSCWSVTKKEYLPLWNMYTPKMRGVRIELPFPVFNIYEIGNNESLFKESELITENHIKLSRGKPYRHIIYTNDKKKLQPKLYRKIKEKYDGVYLDGLGLYKDKIWMFEYEMRFKFSAVPKPITQGILDSFPVNDFAKLIETRTPLDFSYYDLKISDSAFEKMKIILGPRIGPGDEEIVRSLVSNFNPKAKIVQSELRDKIG